MVAKVPGHGHLPSCYSLNSVSSARVILFASSGVMIPSTGCVMSNVGYSLALSNWDCKYHEW